ncbi:MAG: DUF1549 domain-containing protein [Pirellulaceae bacterium]|nr:DUF1549 domain-containing protein [Pirellulaceae bacterium]
MKNLCIPSWAIGPLVALLSPCGLCASEAAGQDGEQFFRESIRPILAQRCWACHGPDEQESGLRLDSRERLEQGGESGQSLIDGADPESSFLLRVLRHEDDVAMPPDERLPERELEAMREWIRQGLPWPTDEAAAADRTLSKAEQLLEQARQHWAFQPVSPQPPPPVSQTSWLAQSVDAFVLAKLERAGLPPSPEADRFTLLRRLKFDLLGLPPTYDEVQAFVTDPAPDAYERLVDRYLSSPHYGERWGRHWLDVARYADTRGYAFAGERRYPYAYTYRDYVIRSLNDDVPFDQFIVEQLAADLLPHEENDPALAALGFLTVGRKYNNRHLDIDDQIDVVGRGVLGLTIACARCHDHKYDPIPIEDYYSLYGVFASSQEPSDLPTVGDPQQTPGYDDFKKELDRLERELTEFRERKHREILESARRHAADYLVRALTKQPEEEIQQLPFIALKGEDFKPRLVQRWREKLAALAGADHPVLGPLHELAAVSDEEFSQQAAAVLARWGALPAGTDPGQFNPLVKAALAENVPQTRLDLARQYGELFSAVYAAHVPHADGTSATAEPEVAAQQLLAILTGPDSLTDIPVAEIPGLLTRAEGNEYRELQRKVAAFQVDSPGAPPRAMIVRENPTPHQPRVFLRGNHNRPGDEVPRQFLLALTGAAREPFQQGSGRLELAREVVRADNPLTARVIVNRVWMHHFGTPLVTSPSDFGLRSEAPIQRDTLDHLTSFLIDHGWSLKALHRHLVLSSTYRQSSLTRDDGERVDPENALYWRTNRRRLEFEALRDALLLVSGELDTTMGGRPVDLTREPFSLRRAVYGFIDRQDLPGLFRVFDLASPDQSCPQRPRTTVPQQALFLMNSSFVLERAKTIVNRADVQSAASTAERIEALYRAVFARAPDADELRIGQAFLEADVPETESAAGLNPWQQYAQLLVMSNTFAFVD